MYSIDQKATSLDVFHQTNSVSKTEQEWVQMLPNYKAHPPVHVTTENVCY